MVKWKSAEIYDAGYAIMSYDIRASLSYWRFRDEEFKTPFGRPYYDTHHFGLPVARIEDVRANAI